MYTSLDERMRDIGILRKYMYLVVFGEDRYAIQKIKIMAAFRGMHVSPAKHSYASVTDRRTDRRRTK